jgi:hypothetical protein
MDGHVPAATAGELSPERVAPPDHRHVAGVGMGVEGAGQIGDQGDARHGPEHRTTPGRVAPLDFDRPPACRIPTSRLQNNKEHSHVELLMRRRVRPRGYAPVAFPGGRPGVLAAPRPRWLHLGGRVEHGRGAGGGRACEESSYPARGSIGMSIQHTLPSTPGGARSEAASQTARSQP